MRFGAWTVRWEIYLAKSTETSEGEAIRVLLSFPIHLSVLFTIHPKISKISELACMYWNYFHQNASADCAHPLRNHLSFLKSIGSTRRAWRSREPTSSIDPPITYYR